MCNYTAADFRRSLQSGPYAWPGGYPKTFICADGEALCHDCAKTEWRNVLEAFRHSHRSGQWRVVAEEIHWEGAPLQCAHCGGFTPSAYGEDDADE